MVNYRYLVAAVTDNFAIKMWSFVIDMISNKK